MTTVTTTVIDIHLIIHILMVIFITIRYIVYTQIINTAVYSGKSFKIFALRAALRAASGIMLGLFWTADHPAHRVTIY